MKPPTTNSETDLLAGALVETNDQLLGLYDLVSLTIESLDEQRAVLAILDRAKSILGADALLLRADRNYSIGPPNDVAALEAVHRIPVQAGDSSATSVPVQTPDGTTVDLGALRKSSPFGTADKKLLGAVGKMLVGAIHRARMHQAGLDQAVKARDHDTASELAQRALPRWRPESGRLDLFAHSSPARAAGGDLFTFALVDDTFHFVVGDVSGKGLPAALMMTTTISASNAAFASVGESGAAAILTTIDSWVYETLADAGLFVTLLVGSYNLTSGILQTCNAGHSPVGIVRNATFQPLAAQLPPIGVLPVESVEACTHQLGPGDRFIAASDGLVEQLNMVGGMFGDERLEALLVSDAMCADGLGKAVFAAVSDFAGAEPQGDDRTLLTFFADPGESSC